MLTTRRWRAGENVGSAWSSGHLMPLSDAVGGPGRVVGLGEALGVGPGARSPSPVTDVHEASATTTPRRRIALRIFPTFVVGGALPPLRGSVRPPMRTNTSILDRLVLAV
jgi:hypothetical protein